MKKSELNRLLKRINKLKAQNLETVLKTAHKDLVLGAVDESKVMKELSALLDEAAANEDTLNRLRATVDVLLNQKTAAKMKRARVGFQAAGGAK